MNLKISMRLDPFYQRFRAGLAQAKERLSSTPSPKAAASPPPPHYLRGDIKADDLADTPLYRAYSELNGGQPLSHFDAEVTWSDSLAGDVLARQLGHRFALLSDDTSVLLRVRSIYEGSREILVIFDRKRKLAPLVEDFIEKRVRLLEAISYESFFMLGIEAERVHLEMATNLNPYLMRKGLMLESLDLLLRRHFPGYTITTEAVNYQVACWIAQKFRANFLNSSSKNYPRLVKRLEEAGVLSSDKAEEILAAEDAFAAYCLLNGALSRDDSGQTPLEYLLFLIEHIPVPKEDLPQLAIEGKIPIS